MRTILVVDDMAVFREPIAAALELRGYETLTASDGQQALRIVEMHRPDLILLDLAMPETDGLTFLRLLHARVGLTAIPVIILTSMTDKELVLQARALGVKGYILKSQFSLDEIVSRIRHLLDEEPTTSHTRSDQALTASATTANLMSPATITAPKSAGAVGRRNTRWGSANEPVPVIPRLLTREQTMERLQQSAPLKTLTGVVAEVVRIAGSNRGDLSDLAAALRRDPALSSRVLHAANCAAYATQRPLITTIDEAVRNIGFSTVRNLTISVGILEASPLSMKDGFNSLRCWQHSLAVATVLEQIAQQEHSGASELAHVIGLCHDLAETILRDLFTEEYSKLSDAMAASRRGQAPADVLLTALGISHDSLVGAVLSSIGLPPEVLQPIQEFFRFGPHRPASTASYMSRLLGIANPLVHGAMLAPSPAMADVMPLTQNECRGLFGEGKTPAIDLEVIRSDVLMLSQHLSQLSAREAHALTEPILPRRNIALMYVRHRIFSRFDPLGLALENLAETNAYEGLPKDPAGWSEAAGLVIATPRHNAEPLSIAQIVAARKAVGREDMPVLMLCGRSEASMATPPLFEVGHYPVYLDELRSFIEAL